MKYFGGRMRRSKLKTLLQFRGRESIRSKLNHLIAAVAKESQGTSFSFPVVIATCVVIVTKLQRINSGARGASVKSRA
jgi:hypothetical protein